MLSQEFAAAFRRDKQGIAKRFRTHTVTLDLVPSRYDSKLVKQTRNVLRATQAVFAQFLGTTLSTVRAWERGTSAPKAAACRLMDEIRYDPAYWRKRIRSLAVRKTGKRTRIQAP